MVVRYMVSPPINKCGLNILEKMFEAILSYLLTRNGTVLSKLALSFALNLYSEVRHKA